MDNQTRWAEIYLVLREENGKRLDKNYHQVFYSGQMKVMFQTLTDYGEQLREYLNKYIQAEDAVDIKDILARLTTDIIGSCVFDIECNTLENPGAKFWENGRRILIPSLVQFAKFVIGLSLPRKLLQNIDFVQSKNDVTNSFIKVVGETVNYRENYNTFRKDFMQLLLQLKHKSVLDGETKYINLTMKEIAAQADSATRKTFRPTISSYFDECYGIDLEWLN